MLKLENVSIFQEIARTPEYMTNVEYIEVLIQAEKQVPMFQNKFSYFDRPFQPSLMFVGKARSLP